MTFQISVWKHDIGYSIKIGKSHIKRFHIGRTHGGWGFWTPGPYFLFRKEVFV